MKKPGCELGSWEGLGEFGSWPSGPNAAAVCSVNKIMESQKRHRDPTFVMVGLDKKWIGYSCVA